MSAKHLSEEELFHAARRIDDAATRAEYLQQACAGDADVQARIEALIRASEQSDALFDCTSPGLLGARETIDEQPAAEELGTTIGRYKLLERIGEGGMGVVYMAEQSEPVRRKVALKVIKPGMDTRQVVARFDAERQALAMMEYPNIAQVLDGGTTEAGLPYFVMELVRGMPITEFCDRKQLTPRERIELFVPVCRAVQHAHQKGIIHRDLKPANILVTLHDGTPVPKVIDFGVAKALGGKLTERTLFTQFAQMVGTPLYMSPEQAALSDLDVDTRSDIYSLGVLLYELLTGTTPFERERVRAAGAEEVRRMIREEDPPRPSSRLSTLKAENQTTVAGSRSTDPRRLSQFVRGELDWIVMKALEKDRTRRYETANGFAQDVQRYLNDEPVEACPPSTTYRLGKLVRRNRAALTTISLIGAVLLVATAVSVWQAVRATHAEQVAELRLREATNQRTRAEQQQRRAEANFQKALEAVDRMLFRVGDRTLRDVPHMQPLQEAILEDALEFYDEFLAQDDTDPSLRFQTAKAAFGLGRIYDLLDHKAERDEVFLRASEILEELLVKDAGNHSYRAELALVYSDLAWTSPPESGRRVSYARRYIELGEQLLTARPENLGDIAMLSKGYGLLSNALGAQGRMEEAQEAARRALEFSERLAGHPGHLATRAAAFHELSKIYANEEFLDLEAAISTSRDGLRLQAELLAKAPDTAHYRRIFGIHSCDLVTLLIEAGRLDEAEAVCRSAQNVLTQLVIDYPDVPRYQSEAEKARQQMVNILTRLDRIEEAQQLVASWPQPATAEAFIERGKHHEQIGLYAEAVTHYERALEQDPTSTTAHLALCTLLTFVSDVELRDLERAIAIGKELVELDPDEADHWAALGLHFRERAFSSRGDGKLAWPRKRPPWKMVNHNKHPLPGGQGWLSVKETANRRKLVTARSPPARDTTNENVSRPLTPSDVSPKRPRSRCSA